LPAWHAGRALFVTRGGSAAVAGTFNDWVDGALVTAPVCGGAIHAVEAALASGRYQYKLVQGGVWSLDPENWAFAYDDFAGNPDGRNAVLDTYDSGLGHLEQPDEELCSVELDNCRPLTTYLPPGYDAPGNAARRYPVLFMHDGQNVFDDHDCCFGHTGWEVNVTLDREIAAGTIAEVVVVGFDHAGVGRINEYGYEIAQGGRRETFMAFQVELVQVRAAALWRLDPDRVFTAGSSLGGNISLHLAFAYPEVYRGAASLSGAFQLGEATVPDVVTSTGKIPMTLYVDHGGTAADGGDGYDANVALRDLLIATGWARTDSPACVAGPDSLCYFHDVGAAHDELAWLARSDRFLRYLFPAE
jgi:predicted alpha/beta superfamily hydrolase